MFGLPTIREWTRFNDWADTRLLESAAGLSDDALDREFPMGVKTLRRTLLHTYNGELVWRNRQQGNVETGWPSEEERVHPRDLLERYQQNWKERNAFLATLTGAELAQVQNYRDSRGTLYKAALGDMILQVLTHSTHHRAQAINMLRHAGAVMPKPGLDYIFLYLQDPTERGPAMDVATLRRFLEYSDRMQTHLLQAARNLNDSQLDQNFEMGQRTLRKTLIHCHVAERWWFDNWTRGPGEPFPDDPAAMPVAEILQRHHEISEARNSFLQKKSDADLHNPVATEPRPGVKRNFPLGVTLLQICHHGIHHRAQASNMLRRVGGPPMDMDYMYSIRVPA